MNIRKDLDNNYIIKEYLSGRTTKDISKELSCPRTTIERRFGNRPY